MSKTPKGIKIYAKEMNLPRRHLVAMAARNAMAPSHFQDLVVPYASNTGRTVYFPVKFALSFTLDVQKLLVKFDSLVAGGGILPHARTQNTALRPLWDTASGFPVLQMLDAYAPLAFPMCGSVAPTLTDWNHQRNFVYPVLMGTYAQDVDLTQSLNVPLDYEVASLRMHSLTDCYDPAFATRPVFRSRDAATNQHSWLWADANRGAPAIAFLEGACVIDMEGNTAGTTLAVYLNAYRREANLEEAKYEALLGTVTTSIGDTQATLTLPSSALAVLTFNESAFYRFEATVASAVTGVALGLRTTNLAIRIVEGTCIYTAFPLNDSVPTLGSIASGYIPLGQALLASCRSPLLTSAGMIFGTRVSEQTQNFPEVSSMSQKDLSSFYGTDNQFHQGEGGSLTKGVYSWHSPSIWLNNPLPIRTVTENPKAEMAAYWIGRPQAFQSMKVLKIEPSVTDSSTNFTMRFTVHTALAAVPRTQVVQGTRAQTLMPDDFAALTQALTACPTFSENDWHEWFTKAAGAVAKVASWIESGVDFVSKALGPVVDIAGGVGGIARGLGQLALV